MKGAFMGERQLVAINEGTGALDETRQGINIGTIVTVDSLEKQIALADKYFELFDHIRKRAISLTDPFDWIDQEGKPYLQETGAAKIAAAFNIQQSELQCVKEREKDDRGNYVTYTWTSILTWNGRSITCIGTSSTRDKFFGRKDNKDLPFTEIDLMNVKKKGWTNLMNRGTKQLLGLTFTWEDIEKYSDGRITQAKCKVFSYAKGGRGGRAPENAETGAKRTAIWNQMLEMSVGDIGEAQRLLKQLTTFTGRDKKPVEGKTDISQVGEGQLKFLEQKLAEIKKEQDAMAEDGEGK
jgi:hypothetical protein